MTITGFTSVNIVQVLRRLPWATCDQTVNKLDMSLEGATGDEEETKGMCLMDF